jgi:hypothetical protein
MTNVTATEAASKLMADRDDERSLHKRMQWFTENWTTEMDLNKRQSAELSADILMLVQAVHRDASRETHALLRTSLAAMPTPAILMAKKD